MKVKQTSDGMVYHVLEDAADVTPEVLDDAAEILDGWFSNDEWIDWEDFIDRLAKRGSHSTPPYDFEEYDNPAVSKIKRHVRSLKAMS